MSKESSTFVGTSPFFLLFLVFLILKLTGFITWSWWWVTAPLWGPTAFVACVVVVVAIAKAVAWLFGGRT